MKTTYRDVWVSQRRRRRRRTRVLGPLLCGMGEESAVCYCQADGERFLLTALDGDSRGHEPLETLLCLSY